MSYPKNARMTPLYNLTIGGMTVFRGFRGFEDQIFAIFSESERTVTTIHHDPDDDYETKEFAYKTTARLLVQRLDLMGFTERNCKEEFSDGIQQYVAQLEEYVRSQHPLFVSHPEHVADRIRSTHEAIEAFKNAQLCEWVEAFDLVADHVYLSEEEIKNLPALHRHLLDAEQKFETYIPFSDLRRLVRAFLCC